VCTAAIELTFVFLDKASARVHVRSDVQVSAFVQKYVSSVFIYALDDVLRIQLQAYVRVNFSCSDDSVHVFVCSAAVVVVECYLVFRRRRRQFCQVDAIAVHSVISPTSHPPSNGHIDDFTIQNLTRVLWLRVVIVDLTHCFTVSTHKP
jgi:hypothetical protein